LDFYHCHFFLLYLTYLGWKNNALPNETWGLLILFDIFLIAINVLGTRKRKKWLGYMFAFNKSRTENLMIGLLGGILVLIMGGYKVDALALVVLLFGVFFILYTPYKIKKGDKCPTCDKTLNEK